MCTAFTAATLALVSLLMLTAATTLAALAFAAAPATLQRRQHVVRCRDAADCTAEAQAALDAGGEAVFAAQLYVVQPLFVRVDRLTVTFAAGARLEALRGGFRGVGGSLVTAANVSDLTIRGSCAAGAPSTWAMWRKDYLNASQGYANQGYRHGLRLENVHRATVSCLTISDTGGDGVYIAGTSGKGVAPTPGSSDVTLSRLSLLRNQRQGMSVIGALHLLVEDSLFADTNGSEPMAGVDLEPNHATDALHNVTFRRCVARANGGGGFQMYLGRFQHGTALPLSVRFEDCRVEGAGACTLQPDSPGCPGFGFYLLPPMARAEPPGSPAVLLQNCSVQKTVQPALVFGGVSTPGPSVAVRGGVFEAPLRASPAVSPVQIVGGAAWSGTVGGISFEEPVIRYGAGAVAAPWLRAQSAPAVANVSGRVRVETGGLPTAVCTPKLQPAVTNITVKADCISRLKSDDAAGPAIDLDGSSSRVTVWWKPANASSLSADVAGMKRVLYATGVIIYCGFAALPDGSFGAVSRSAPFAASWGDPGLCLPAVLEARRAGLTTHIVVEGRFDEPNIAAAIARGGASFGDDVVSVLRRMGLTLGAGGVASLNFDWEPGRNRSAPAPSEAEAARFTAALARRLSNVEVGVSVDGQPYPGLPWRNLSHTLTAGGVQSVYAMGLYHGTSSSEWRAKLTEAVRSVGNASAAESAAVFAVGLQAGQTKFAWENTTQSIAERFEAIKRANVRHVGVFAWARGDVSGGNQRPPPDMLAEWSARLRDFVGTVRPVLPKA